jgi:hypothetical protein
MIVRLSVGSSQTCSTAADSSGENASREPRRDGQDVLAAPLALDTRHSRTITAVLNVSTHPNIFNLPSACATRCAERVRWTRAASGRDGSLVATVHPQLYRCCGQRPVIHESLPAIGRAGDAPRL